MELKEFQKIYANHIKGGFGCPDYHRSTTLGLVRNLVRDDIDPAVPTLPVIVGMPLTFNIADGLTMKLISYFSTKNPAWESGRHGMDRPPIDSLVKPHNQQISWPVIFRPPV